MSSTFKPRRVLPSSLNTPTEINVKRVTRLLQNEAERILSEFIATSENISKGALDTRNATTGFSDSVANGMILTQLRRIQRNMRGLPPFVPAALIETKHTSDFLNEGTLQNKRIKFNDLVAENNDDSSEDSNESVTKGQNDSLMDSTLGIEERDAAEDSSDVEPIENKSMIPEEYLAKTEIRSPKEKRFNLKR